MTLGAIRSPTLQRLTLTTPHITAPILQSMNEAEWPCLTELCLSGRGERFDIRSQARRGRLDDAYERIDAATGDEELKDLARDCLQAERDARPRARGLATGKPVRR